MTTPSPSTSRPFLCRKTWGSVDDYIRNLPSILFLAGLDGFFIINFINKPKDFNAWLVLMVGILPITVMLGWYSFGKVKAVWDSFKVAQAVEPNGVKLHLEFLFLVYFMLSTSAALPVLATLVSNTNWEILKSL